MVKQQDRHDAYPEQMHRLQLCTLAEGLEAGVKEVSVGCAHTALSL